MPAQTIINIPDTVGYSNPAEYGALFKFFDYADKKRKRDHLLLTLS
jgi:isopropylmalate/homocitrate/citramalate synthase